MAKWVRISEEAQNAGRVMEGVDAEEDKTRRPVHGALTASTNFSET
jgi:hypothetical protein